MQLPCSPCPSVDKKGLRCPPRPSAALRGQKGSKMSSAPLRGQKKVFFAPPSRPFADKKGVLPAPSGLLWRKILDAIPCSPCPSVDKKGLRCPPRPSAALRGQKGSKMSSAPLRGQKKVFFAPLRAPSRTKKVFFLPLRGLLWRPNLDAIALFSLPLRGQKGSKMSSAPLRGQKKVFFAPPSRPFADKKGVLPAPSRAIVASDLRCNWP